MESKMITKRVYFTISIIMLLVLFLFQSTGIIRRKYNNYDSNSFKESTATDLSADDEYEVLTDREQVILAGKKYVVYIGNIDDDYGRTVYQWCRFTKRNVISYTDIDDFTMSNWNKPEMVLLDSNYVDYYNQMDAVEAISNADVNVTLCNLPDYDTTRKNERLMEYCSIESSARRIVASGLRVFDDFLLGGEIWYNEDNDTNGTYNDINIVVPWYVTTTGTKTYVAAELSAEDYPDVKNEDQPSLVWRKRWNDAYVFCINGEFIKDISGMGILSAIAYDSKDYDIYPVVDAQTYIVENFPYLSSENETQIQKYYSRTTEAFAKNVIWPDLTNLSTKLSVKFTYMIAPQLNYADKTLTSISELDYFFRLIREQSTEVGLTNSRGTRDNLSEKLSADRSTYRNYLGNYEFLSILLSKEEISNIDDVNNDILDDVKTYVVSSDEFDGSGLFEYTDDGVLMIQTPTSGDSYTFGKDFTVRCLNTVLAYNCIDVNLRDIFYPQDEDNLWNKYIKEMSGAAENLTLTSTYFSKCTVSELDKHVREMLSMDYTYRMDGGDLIVDIKGDQEVSRFVLRTHKTAIKSVTGGTYTEIEDGAYIITTTEKQIRITL